MNKLRRDFEGFEARFRHGFTDGDYSESQAALLGGYQWETGGIMAAFEYTENDPLFGSEVADWYQQDNRTRGGRDLRSTNCAPGTITAGGQTYAIPAGGVTAANVGSLAAGTRNLCFYGGEDHVIWSQERTSLTGAFDQEFGPGLVRNGDKAASKSDEQHDGQAERPPQIQTHWIPPPRIKWPNRRCLGDCPELCLKLLNWLPYAVACRLSAGTRSRPKRLTGRLIE